MLNDHHIETAIYAAVSEPEHTHLTREFGGIPCEVKNRPLGNKWNTVVSRAHEEPPDYYFIVGSDDFFSNSLIEKYVVWMQGNYPYIGLGGMFFCEPSTRRALKFIGYPQDHVCWGVPVGSGRMIRADLLPPEPWGADEDIGLDGSITRLLDDQGRILLPVTETDSAVDVKTSTNMWSYDTLAQSYHKAPLTEATIEGALSNIPERKELLSL